MTATASRIEPDRRVCIIGGGAAGMSAALALRAQGFQHITVLERSAEGVGGKCRTIVEDGVAMDTGAIYVLPNYPVVSSHIARAGVALRPAAPLVHLSPDGAQRPFGQHPAHAAFGAKAAEYLRLGAQLVRHRAVMRRPLGELAVAEAAATSRSLSSWLDAHRLGFFREVAYPLLRCFGFGFEEQALPFAYTLRVLPQLARGGNLLALWRPDRVPLYHLEGGFGALWRALAAELDVRVGVTVERVTRGDHDGVAVTSAGTFEFDALILACPLDRAAEFLDTDAQERDLIGRLRSFPVWHAAVRADGLPAAAILEQNQGWERRGRTMIALRYYADRPWYYLFGYGRDDWDDAAIAGAIGEDLAAHGATLRSTPIVRSWPYMPHFGAEDFAAGCLGQLEARQGTRATYYVGELLGGIGVESAAAHATRLVARRFGAARTAGQPRLDLRMRSSAMPAARAASAS